MILKTALVLTVSSYLITASVIAATPPDIKQLTVNGIDVPYVDEGKGEPVLFVHGAIADLHIWSDYLEPVAQNHQFLSYTRRFYGTHPWPDPVGSYNHDVHAADLAAFIEALDVGPVHLVTWSSGAISATIVAHEHPDLVRSLIHYEPVMDEVLANVAEASELQRDWNSRWQPVSDQLAAGDERHALRKMVEVVFELPPGGFESLPAINQDILLRNARTLPILFNGKTDTAINCAYLGEITSPTLVVLGGETHRYWEILSKRTMECFPNSRLEIMSRVNHDGPIRQPQEFTKLLLSHVDANSRN